jgi:hypothetical protein
MKLKDALILPLTVIALLSLSYGALLLFRMTTARAGLQKLIETTQPDISSEGGLYGHYRVYTGMLMCEDCDSIATRLILKSQRDSSVDGVATLERIKINTGKRPIKQVIQKALWTLSGSTTIQHLSLFADNNKTSTFSLEQDAKTNKWKFIKEDTARSDTSLSDEDHIGRLELIAEGNTIP